MRFLLDYARELKKKNYLCVIKLCDNDLNRNQHNATYETPPLILWALVGLAWVSKGVFIFYVAIARKTKAKEATKKTIEQTLWDSANELRGNLDAAEYKSVVLGLVFFKYINDCFKVKHDELVAEGAGFEEDSDEYIGDNIFLFLQMPVGIKSSRPRLLLK